MWGTFFYQKNFLKIKLFIETLFCQIEVTAEINKFKDKKIIVKHLLCVFIRLPSCQPML